MGRYIAWEDVAGRYPDTSKLLSNGATATGSYWLAAAEAEVDARLAVRYQVPFTPPAPELVRDLAIDLTYYKMTWRQKTSSTLKTDLDKRFAMIASGTMLLTTSAGLVGAVVGQAALTEDYHTSFGVDDPTMWNVSSDWQRSERDARGQF